MIYTCVYNIYVYLFTNSSYRIWPIQNYFLVNYLLVQKFINSCNTANMISEESITESNSLLLVAFALADDVLNYVPAALTDCHTATLTAQRTRTQPHPATHSRTHIPIRTHKQ